MSKIRLMQDSGAAHDQKTMVWIGDSMTVVSYWNGSAYPMLNNFQRAGDLIARSLSTRGVIRFKNGYFDDATGAYRIWERNGTVNGTVSDDALLHTGNYTRSQVQSQIESLSDRVDLIYHSCAVNGSAATDGSGSEWDGADVNIASADRTDDYIDYLFVDFFTNDYSGGGGNTTNFQSGLIEKLDWFDNVGQKFMCLTWANDGVSQPWQRMSASAAFYTAVENAVAAATPGDKQTTIPIQNLFGVSGGMLRCMNSGTYWTDSSGVHLDPWGAQLHAKWWTEHVDEAWHP